MKIELGKTEIIHFVGIGGIGMSGLSLIMQEKGFKVQGSDQYINKNIARLKKENIKIFIGQKKENLKNATIVIISSAIKKNNPEIIEAKKKKLPIISRGKMLAHIVSLTKNIVIAGSHGKTTTTSLVSSIFQRSKLDPTIINGGVINSIKSTAKLGKSDWSILEADESDGSFVHIPPTYSIITNVDREHMDFYKSMKDLKLYFKKFIEKVPSFGKSFICLDDKINKELIKELKNQNFYTFGTNINSNFLIKNIKQTKKYTEFNLHINIPNKRKSEIKNIQIPLLGVHNVRNSVAATAVALTIGIPISDIKNGLLNFKGVQRRFNYLFEINKVPFFDDYAHHPTEISSVLDGVRKVYSKEEIVCIFQPHRISRVKNLKIEFSKCFKNANTILLCPIYKAGENINLGFSYEAFARLIAKNSNVNLIILKNELDLKKITKNIAFGNKIFIAMGAGSVSNWVRNLN